MSAPTREARLWARLREAGQVAGDAPAQADTPWYVAVLSGTGAWMAAAFVFVFVIDGLDRLWDRPVPMFGLGAACALSGLFVMHRTRDRVFVEQLAIALGLAGQLMMGFALFKLHDRWFGSSETPWPWIPVAAIALAMHAFGRLPSHRFLCGGLFAVAVLGACSADVPALRVVAAPLLAWLALAAWWRSEAHDRLAPVLSPLAWALSLTALLAAGFVDLDDWALGGISEWAGWLRPLGDAAMVPLLPVCAHWLSRRQPGMPTRSRTVAIGLSLVMALLWWRAPGVSVGATLALVGFGLHRPALLVVGLCGIGGALLCHYFQLDTTLLEKSGWLLVAGATLLLARVVAHRLPAAGASR